MITSVGYNGLGQLRCETVPTVAASDISGGLNQLHFTAQRCLDQVGKTTTTIDFSYPGYSVVTSPSGAKTTVEPFMSTQLLGQTLMGQRVIDAEGNAKSFTKTYSDSWF